MAILSLTCAGCGKRINTEHERRIHICPLCNTASYLKPGSYSLFLRLLSSDPVINTELSRLAGHEDDLLKAISVISREENELREQHDSDSRRSTATFRILIMNFIIATIAALIVFADFPVRLPSLAPAGIAVALMFISVILMIFQSTNLRSVEYRLSQLVERRNNAKRSLLELQRRIDLAVIGSSGKTATVR